MNYSKDGYKQFFANKNANNNKLVFKPVSNDDVLKIISSLKPKSSSGFDGISTKLLQSAKSTLCAPITKLINQCIDQNVFPDPLKIAKVVPVYKKDSKHELSNYRPISLLPSLSKIFEKVISIQITDFFISNDLFSDSQYGYRAKHSTVHAAIEMTEKLYELIKDGKVPLSIFLDLSKAFDTLDYEVLLWKLSFYGIRDDALLLISSYLSNRQQFVEFNGIQSKCLPLTIGVPQGSILGPLLFIIYTNDISAASKLFNYIMYADDTSLISTPELLDLLKLM